MSHYSYVATHYRILRSSNQRDSHLKAGNLIMLSECVYLAKRRRQWIYI